MSGDLFGEPITTTREVQTRADGKPRRKPTRPRGYAAEPGTGPTGESCGTCRHHCVICYSKPYHKCSEFRRLGGKWTGGPGSDIRVRSPACRLWEPGEPQKLYGG
jgi:hypothetical protein